MENKVKNKILDKQLLKLNEEMVMTILRLEELKESKDDDKINVMNQMTGKTEEKTVKELTEGNKAHLIDLEKKEKLIIKLKENDILNEEDKGEKVEGK